MDPSRGMDSRYNLNYSMSSIGLSLADQADMYGNPAAVAALGGRPPSGGLIQTMGAGGGGGVGLNARSGSLMPNTTQCQSLVNSSGNSAGGSGQQRGIKRAGSDCYDDHHRGGSGGMTTQSLQGLESCSAGGNGQHAGQQQQQQQASGGNVPDVVDDSYNALQNKKSPPANGKKTKGRVKIKMEYIDNKLRRYTTFSKRKTGIMKKAYELSTLTGTQVMLLVASETGHVYTFATRKLQPMITSEAGKQLIQTCLNSPDPPSVGGGDQRMSATGFEETELSYNIADEDSKDDRSPVSSANESEESSDIDSPGPTTSSNCNKNAPDMVLVDGNSTIENPTAVAATANPRSNELVQQYEPHCSKISVPPKSQVPYHLMNANTTFQPQEKNAVTAATTTIATDNPIYPASSLSNIPQEVLLQLIQSGHLQLHTEEDGSGHQYVAIPLSSSTANLIKSSRSNTTAESSEIRDLSERSNREGRITSREQAANPKVPSATMTGFIIKEELE